MSAPHSIGRIRYGVGTVLSTISGTPVVVGHAGDALDVEHVVLRVARCVSPKNAFVFGRTAARHWSRSSGSSTNVTSMPSFGSV